MDEVRFIGLAMLNWRVDDGLPGRGKCQPEIEYCT